MWGNGKTLGDAVDRLDRENFFMHLTGTVLTPAAIAILGVMSHTLWKDYGPTATIVPWLFVLVVHILASYRYSFPQRSVYHLAQELEEREGEVAELANYARSADEAYKVQTLIMVLFSNWRRINVVFSATKNVNSESYPEYFDDILYPIVDKAYELFGTRYNELWNFALYVHSANEDQLVPVWRSKAAAHPSQGFGRTWGRGAGHIGKAWVDAVPKITADARPDDVAALMRAPAAQVQPYDDETYISFASIPVGPVAETGRTTPFGVLVATSDIGGRFTRENALVLWHAAEAISTTFSLHGADMDSIIAIANPKAGRMG